MNTFNEMCLAWFMWVNGNYDILIMTITLIVVAGLVLEVVRLKKNVKDLDGKFWDLDDSIETLRLTQEDQVQVNINIAKDIDELWGGQLESYIKHCQLETKLERISDDQVKVNVHLAEDISKLATEVKHLKYSDVDLLKLINAKRKTIRK